MYIRPGIIDTFKMTDSLYIYCSHPVAADRTLFVERIDLAWSPAQLRNFIFRERNLNGIVRVPEDLVLHHYSAEGTHQGNILDLRKSLSEQGIVAKGDLYMVVRLIEAAGE